MFENYVGNAIRNVLNSFLQVGQRLVFREGRTKAVGNVTKVIYHSPSAGHQGQGGIRAVKMARNEQRNRGQGGGSGGGGGSASQQNAAGAAAAASAAGAAAAAAAAATKQPGTSIAAKS